MHSSLGHSEQFLEGEFQTIFPFEANPVTLRKAKVQISYKGWNGEAILLVHEQKSSVPFLWGNELVKLISTVQLTQNAGMGEIAQEENALKPSSSEMLPEIWYRKRNVFFSRLQQENLL